MDTKQNHKNGDKHMAEDFNHSQEKIGLCLLRPSSYHLLTCSSMRGRSGYVRPLTDNHLHRPHRLHLPALPLLRHQGGPGERDEVKPRVVVKPIVNIGPDLVHYQSTSPLIGKSCSVVWRLHNGFPVIRLVNCSGVREGRHLQAGTTPEEWSQGPGSVLHHPLH